MKKTYKDYSKILFLLASFVCLFIFNACGLDEFYVIDPPYNVTHEPVFTDTSTMTSFENKYFEFVTNEAGSNNESFRFVGTDVYYKIYDSYSRMYSDKEAIIKLASDSATSSSASDRLITSYKYQKLHDGTTSNVLIPSKGSSQRVKIRLTDYSDIDAYRSEISIDGVRKGKPVRSVYGNLTFNFGRSEDNDKIPVSGDDDYTKTSSSAVHYWYVAMFAVAYGQDTTFTKYYSTPLYLGNIVIDSDSEDN